MHAIKKDGGGDDDDELLLVGQLSVGGGVRSSEGASALECEANSRIFNRFPHTPSPCRDELDD